MKLAEWEDQHNYGLKRVCKFCRHATVTTIGDRIQTVFCEEKIKAKVGEVVKQNLSCDLWEDKK